MKFCIAVVGMNTICIYKYKECSPPPFNEEKEALFSNYR